MAAQIPPRFRFSRRAKIKQARDFTRLRQQGKRLTLSGLVVNWQPISSGAASRVGVITSARLGGAVTRNRVKRLLRESFRLHQHEIATPVDLVLVARASIVRRSLAQVEQEFLTGLRKAGLLKRAQ